MPSLRVLALLLTLSVVCTFACAPQKTEKKHGQCKFYVDGTSDTSSSRKRRDTDSASTSGESDSGEKSATSTASTKTTTVSSSESGGGGGGGSSGRYNRTKKKKNVKCYKYEDGTKDEGATLNKGVTYTVTVSKSS